LPNFHRLLKKHDIDYEQLTAGKYKRTLSLFGDNALAGREKAQADLEDAHRLFKDFVREHRPQIDIDELATGEYWFARRALELGLVDRLATSDEFIGEHLDSHAIYRVRARQELGWRARLWQAARSAADFV
jgi:serine protease SohB